MNIEHKLWNPINHCVEFFMIDRTHLSTINCKKTGAHIVERIKYDSPQLDDWRKNCENKIVQGPIFSAWTAPSYSTSKQLKTLKPSLQTFENTTYLLYRRRTSKFKINFTFPRVFNPTKVRDTISKLNSTQNNWKLLPGSFPPWTRILHPNNN